MLVHYNALLRYFMFTRLTSSQLHCLQTFLAFLIFLVHELGMSLLLVICDCADDSLRLHALLDVRIGLHALTLELQQFLCLRLLFLVRAQNDAGIHLLLRRSARPVFSTVMQRVHLSLVLRLQVHSVSGHLQPAVISITAVFVETFHDDGRLLGVHVLQERRPRLAHR